MKTILAAAALVATAGIVNAGTITFDNFSNGYYFDGTPVDLGDGLMGAITATGGQNRAQILGTNNPKNIPAADDLVDAKHSVTGETYTGGKALVIADRRSKPNRPMDNNIGGTLTLTFDRMLTILGFTGIDLEMPNQGVTVSADGGAFTGGYFNGNDQWTDFALAVPLTGMSFTFKLGGSGAIDNLQWRDAPSPVPVPAAGLLLVAGLGALAVARRRATA